LLLVSLWEKQGKGPFPRGVVVQER